MRVPRQGEIVQFESENVRIDARYRKQRESELVFDIVKVHKSPFPLGSELWADLVYTVIHEPQGPNVGNRVTIALDYEARQTYVVEGKWTVSVI
jgi:hypothetical protein